MRGFLSGSNVKNLTAFWENSVQSLGGEDSLEKGVATHSSILAWKIPWNRKNLVGYSPWGCEKVGHNLVTKKHHHRSGPGVSIGY